MRNINSQMERMKGKFGSVVFKAPSSIRSINAIYWTLTCPSTKTMHNGRALFLPKVVKNICLEKRKRFGGEYIPPDQTSTPRFSEHEDTNIIILCFLTNQMKLPWHSVFSVVSYNMLKILKRDVWPARKPVVSVDAI